MRAAQGCFHSGFGLFIEEILSCEEEFLLQLPDVSVSVVCVSFLFEVAVSQIVISEKRGRHLSHVYIGMQTSLLLFLYVA